MNLKSVILISILICGLLIGPVSAAAGDTILFTQVNVSSNLTQIWNNGTFQVNPAIQGVTTTNGIDINKSGGNSDAGVLTLDYAQQIQPSKSQMSGATVYLKNVSIPTGMVTIRIQSNNITANTPDKVLASNTFSASTLTSSYAPYTVNLPALWSSGKYWVSVVVDDNSGSMILRGQSGSFSDHWAQSGKGVDWTDQGTGFQFDTSTYYAKNTEATNITVNGNTSVLDTGDAFGMLSGANVDTYHEWYTWSKTVDNNPMLTNNDVDFASSMQNISFSSGTAGTTFLGNGWGKTNLSGTGYYVGNLGGVTPSNPVRTNFTIKTNFIYPVKTITFTTNALFGGYPATIYGSSDGLTYTQIATFNASDSTFRVNSTSTSYFTGNRTVFLRFDSIRPVINSVSINATINTSTAATLIYQNGANTVNITSNGRAVSSSLDPSLMANVSLIEWVPPTITANFSVSNTTGFETLLTHFTDTSTVSGATIDAWNWSFGDGNVSSSQNPSHTYEVPGTHTVNLTITNTSLSLVSTKLGSVTVYKVPVADFSSFNTQGTAPFTTYLYDTSTNLNSGPYTYYWDLGDGNTSTDQNLYYTWNLTGTFDVKHSVTDSFTTKWKNTTGYVTVGTPVVAPVASFYGGPQLGAPPLKVFFTDVSSNTPTGWNWSMGDGTFNESQNPTHIYSSSGFFTVNLTATNTAGSNTTSQTNFVMVY